MNLLSGGGPELGTKPPRTGTRTLRSQSPKLLAALLMAAGCTLSSRPSRTVKLGAKPLGLQSSFSSPCQSSPSPSAGRLATTPPMTAVVESQCPQVEVS